MYIFCSIKLSTFWQTFALIRARLELLIHGRHLPPPSIEEGGGPSSARQFVGDLHKIPLEAVASLGQLRVVISLFLSFSLQLLLWHLLLALPRPTQSALQWVSRFGHFDSCWCELFHLPQCLPVDLPNGSMKRVRISGGGGGETNRKREGREGWAWAGNTLSACSGHFNWVQLLNTHAA